MPNSTNHNPFIIHSLKQKSSFIWKNLLLGQKTFLYYTKWAIGDGSLIRFWLDPWINTLPKPLAYYLEGPLNKNDLNLTLKEVRSNNTWYFTNLSYPIPTVIQGKITDTLIPQYIIHQDTLCWGITTNVVFSVSSCYHALTLTRNPSSSIDIITNI